MGVFHTTRWRLTLWYMVISLALLTLFTIAALLAEHQAFVAVRQLVHSEVRGIVFNAILQAEIDNFERDFAQRLILFDVLMFIVSGLASYILSGRTLEPIEKMIKEQEAFAADASHELRTPLATIAMEIEARKRDRASLKKQDRDLLDSIQAEISRMRSIVAGLLSLVRTREGNVVDLEKVDFVHLTGEVVDSLKARMREKKLNVTLSLEDTPMVMGQVDDLRQLLLILLDNAILYTPLKGDISVSIQKAGNTVDLMVYNSGVSVPQSELPLLFNRFYRGESVVEPGTGLGLAIARVIVDRHDGSIAVASPKDDVGVTFRVRLPMAVDDGL